MKSYQKRDKDRKLRNLESSDKCPTFSDCFNCTSYSDKNVDCYWYKDGCRNNTKAT